MLRSAGDRAVHNLSPPQGDRPDEFREANNRILAAVREFPKRLIGLCYLNPQYPKESLEELNRCLGEEFAGMGEVYAQAKISDPLCYPLIEKCIQEKAIILVHARADTALLRPGLKASAPPTTSIPNDFVAAARRYPEAILIYSHIGGGDWEYACKTLRSARAVFADTSGSNPGSIRRRGLRWKPFSGSWRRRPGANISCFTRFQPR